MVVRFLRLLCAVTNSRSFPLFVFALPWSDEVDLDPNMLANKPLAEEFACLDCIVRLFGIAQPAYDASAMHTAIA